jgi:putative transposase
MLTGIKNKFYPSREMSSILSQWIGCARVIYNAKCDEDRYLRAYARKYLTVGTFPTIDKSYSQYKTNITPFLKDCPSQILRNSATIWHASYRRFMNGIGGRPKHKNKAKGNYIWLTRELFTIRWDGRKATVVLGTHKNPIGEINIRWNKDRIPKTLPASIWIKRTAHQWRISFAYEDGHIVDDVENEDHLSYLRMLSKAELEAIVTGIDRGIAKPVQTDVASSIYSMTREAIHRSATLDLKKKRYQKRLARQKKGSKRRFKTVQSISKIHEQITDIRHDFWHKTTHKIATQSKVVVIEDLKLKNMTKHAKPKVCPNSGKWLKNGAKAKSGLNRAMLNAGLGLFDIFLTYKMKRLNKPLFKVSPYQTSQECAKCGHTHPKNRISQAGFHCLSCHHTDNADHNAAVVIKKRAIDLILHSGTELVGINKNVLRSRTNTLRYREGEQNHRKTPADNSVCAIDYLSKKTTKLALSEARCFSSE